MNGIRGKAMDDKNFSRAVAAIKDDRASIPSPLAIADAPNDLHVNVLLKITKGVGNRKVCFGSHANITTRPQNRPLSA